MLLRINFEKYLLSPNKYTLVDVRSPAEYAHSTITGAVNIPLFSNDERAHVGTVYKQESKAAAVTLGVEYASRSLPMIYDSFIKNLSKKKKFLIFCARGGMRSESVANFISSLGLPVAKLEKGYKGYRNYIVENLPKLIKQAEFITLYGKTGTGKTAILHELTALGANTLDLEGCANHRGSVFGGVGLGATHSQKKFETLLFDALQVAGSGPIFTEGESKRIGSVYMPDELMQAIDSGRKLMIEADSKRRTEILKNDYVSKGFKPNEAKAALEQLVRYIGKERVLEYANLIDSGQLDKVIETLMVKYYDITYNTNRITAEESFVNECSCETAQAILEYIGFFDT